MVAVGAAAVVGCVGTYVVWNVPVAVTVDPGGMYVVVLVVLESVVVVVLSDEAPGTGVFDSPELTVSNVVAVVVV